MLKILVKKIIFNFFYICPKFVAFTLSIFTYIFFIKNLKKNTNYKLNFLVLNHKRFNQDLNILAEDNNFSFFTINEKFLYYLISPYVYLIKNDLKKNKWWQIQSKNNYIKFLKDGSNFIHFFLKYLHKFKKIDDNETLIEDIIVYAVPFGFIGRIMHSIYIKRDLNKIFAYRAKKIKEIFNH